MHEQSKTDANDALTEKQKSIVIVSALTATGDLGNLKQQLNTALDAGLTINEIKEVLVQLYAFCGFPRSLNAISTFKTVLDERKSKGFTDNVGKQIVIENNTGDKYEQGRKVLEKLTKTPQSKPAPGFGEFAPRIDAFLKEHLFADIFNSDVLSYQQRELVTISALAAMAGVELQLESHLNMGINTGLTPEQLSGLVALIEIHTGNTQSNAANRVLQKVLKFKQ